MAGLNSNEPMLDMFIFESTQLLEQLESLILQCEKSRSYCLDAINEIFRIMHTIKGSSAMMLFNNISTLSHSIEDLFYFLREQKPHNVDFSILSDLVLEGVDFIKVEVEKIKNSDVAGGDCTSLISAIKDYLSQLKQMNNATDEKQIPAFEKQRYFVTHSKNDTPECKNIYKATIFFQEGCEMENIRAYTIIRGLREITGEAFFLPEDIMENDDTVNIIREQGFIVYLKTDIPYNDVHDFFMQTIFLKNLNLELLENDSEFRHLQDQCQVQDYMQKYNHIQTQNNNQNHDIIQKHDYNQKQDTYTSQATPKEQTETQSSGQSIISVNVSKLDKLMDLMGEMVIAEAMVTQNPDLNGLELNNFHKAAQQLHKITSELQDMVMSIRMVPLSATFQKMHRIVRDMSKKLNKEVGLKLIGEETEVDKNIIEHISDPLMHLVRNAIDHGLEAIEDREALGKPIAGMITLEAKNAGSDVLLIVRDDGRGLNKEKILEKARNNGLLYKSESEMNDKEIYNLIFLPGFSTKDAVSEFSGRGVGMDVVVKNIESVGGSVSIDSTEGAGSAITLKIPLTLAIIDGMNVRVGNSSYTIPITSIKESFRPKETDIIRDPDGNEMIMVRGQCYPILRLHEIFQVKNCSINFSEGILIMVEQDGKTSCIFADELLGQQQVVVKALPNYIKNIKKINGLSGCTLLGDGNISLILDIAGLIFKT